MAESTETTQVAAPAPAANAGKVAKATEAAAAQAGFMGGTKTQAELESMSGAEVAAYLDSIKGKAPAAKAAPKTEAKGADPMKEAAKEAMRKFKVKVEGQETEVDEAELIRGYSHQKGANKILQDGVAARKQAEEFISMMRDPEKFYETAKKLGHDPRVLAEKYLAKQLENELLDPRERELREAKAKLKEIEDMDRVQKEAVNKQRDEILKAKYAKDYSDQFVAALQETGMPATKGTVASMAKYVSRAAKIGFQMTAAEAAQLVREDTLLAHQKLIGDSDGETLMKLLGEEVANKVRKYDTQRLANPERHLKTPTEQPEARRPRESNGKRMTPAQWRAFNRR